MGLNRQAGNMYPWVTHTWNTIKGRCYHDCHYCYMKRFKLNPVRLDESEFKTGLGKNNTIFVGSSCDMWAEDIPTEWIMKTLEHCSKYKNNTYLFQSKNPKRFFSWVKNDYVDISWGKKIILGTTIETNRGYDVSKAPSCNDRVFWLEGVPAYKKMVSIEPIMDFDIDAFYEMLKMINPSFISIGADSKGHNLPEPDSDKTLELIDKLKNISEVKIKDNLKRITAR